MNVLPSIEGKRNVGDEHAQNVSTLERAKEEVSWTGSTELEERKIRVLPHRAEDEIRRMRYNARKEATAKRRRRRSSGQEMAQEKKRKSNGDVWFTTLAEVSGDREKREVPADDDDALDALFEQSLREIYGDGRYG